MAAFRAVAGLTFAMLVGLSPTATGQEASYAQREYTVVSRFLNAVDSYVVQHHRFFEPLADEIMCLPDEAIATANSLAAVRREMRPAPREGAIFTPEIGAWFRQRFEAIVRTHRYDRLALLDDMDEGVLVAPPVFVNEVLDWAMPAGTLGTLTRELPLLPEELGYRFAGRDLVLLEIETGVVVDVMRGALPAY